jgi:branched-chain amino acid transport system ATP-binding protein
MSLLAFDDVHMSFRGLKALDGVTLVLEAGCLTGLIGPNGSGKTTLLNVLSGHLRPDRGDVRFADRSLVGLQPSAIARLGIGRMFQITRLFRRLSTIDNLVTSGCALGMSLRGALKRADQLIEDLELQAVRDEDGGNLSGGQQKLLEFGSVFMGDPQLAVLDEPFAAIHPRMREVMVRFIRSRHEQGYSFVIVSHDLPVVLDLTDDLIAMNAGQVIARGDSNTVLQDPTVIEGYLGEAVVSREATGEQRK